jgi:hypothetical protein
MINNKDCSLFFLSFDSLLVPINVINFWATASVLSSIHGTVADGKEKCHEEKKLRPEMRYGFSGCESSPVCIHLENAELGVGASPIVNSSEFCFIQGLTTLSIDDCDEENRVEWRFPAIYWEDSDSDDNMSSSSLSSASYSSNIRQDDTLACCENGVVASSSALPQTVLVSPASNKQLLPASDLHQNKNCMVRSTAVTCLRALLEISCVTTKRVGSSSASRDNHCPATICTTMNEERRSASIT